MMRSYAATLGILGTLACAQIEAPPHIKPPARTYEMKIPAPTQELERRMAELEKPVLDRIESIELKNEFFDLLRAADLSQSLETTYGVLSLSSGDTLNLFAGGDRYFVDFAPDGSYLAISVEKIMRNKNGTVRGVNDVLEMDNEKIECLNNNIFLESSACTENFLGAANHLVAALREAATEAREIR